MTTLPPSRKLEAEGDGSSSSTQQQQPCAMEYKTPPRILRKHWQQLKTPQEVSHVFFGNIIAVALLKVDTMNDVIKPCEASLAEWKIATAKELNIVLSELSTPAGEAYARAMREWYTRVIADSNSSSSSRHNNKFDQLRQLREIYLEALNSLRRVIDNDMSSNAHLTSVQSRFLAHAKSTILIACALTQTELNLNHVQSLALLAEALEIRQKQSEGGDDMDVATAMLHLARLQLRTGPDSEAALCTMKRAVDIVERLALRSPAKHNIDLIWFLDEFTRAMLAANKKGMLPSSRRAQDLLPAVLPPLCEDVHLVIPTMQILGSALQAANSPREGGQNHLDALSMLRNGFAQDKMQEIALIESIAHAVSGRSNSTIFQGTCRMALMRLWSLGTVELTPEERASWIKRELSEAALREFNHIREPQQQQQHQNQQFLRLIMGDPDAVRFNLDKIADVYQLYQFHQQQKQHEEQEVQESTPSLSGEELYVAVQQLAENPRVIDRQQSRLEQLLMHHWIRQFSILPKEVFKILDRVSPHMPPDEIDAMLNGSKDGAATPHAHDAVSSNSANLHMSQSANPIPAVLLRIVGCHLVQSGIAVIVGAAPRLGLRLAEAGITVLARAHADLPDTTICWALSAVSVAALRCCFFNVALRKCTEALHRLDSLKIQSEKRELLLRATLSLNAVIISRFCVSSTVPRIGHLPSAVMTRAFEATETHQDPAAALGVAQAAAAATAAAAASGGAIDTSALVATSRRRGAAGRSIPLEHFKRAHAAVEAVNAAPRNSVSIILKVIAFDELGYAQLLRNDLAEARASHQLAVDCLQPFFVPNEASLTVSALPPGAPLFRFAEHFLSAKSNLALCTLVDGDSATRKVATEMLADCAEMAEKIFSSPAAASSTGAAPPSHHDFVALVKRNSAFATYFVNNNVPGSADPIKQQQKPQAVIAQHQLQCSVFPVSLLGLTVVDDSEFASIAAASSSSSSSSSSPSSSSVSPLPSSVSPPRHFVPASCVPLYLPAGIAGKAGWLSATPRETLDEQMQLSLPGVDNSAQRPRDAQRLFSITGNRVVVYRRCEPPFEVFARYTLPRSLRVKAKRLIDHTVNALRHPNILMALVANKHRDGSVNVDLEYADGGTMMAFIPKFDPEYRDLVAMSTLRQVLQAIVYLDVVHSGQRHRHICPRYVYLRRDGCIKLDVPDMFDRETVAANQDHFLESPYTAPECRATPGSFFENGDSRSDLWSLGVLLLAIVTGRTLQPRRKALREGDTANRDSAPTDDERTAFLSERDAFDALVTSDDNGLWRHYVRHDYLRYFIRKFLHVRPNSRGSAMSALAYTFVFGGVIEARTAGELAPVIKVHREITFRGGSTLTAAPATATAAPAAAAAAAATESEDDDVACPAETGEAGASAPAPEEPADATVAAGVFFERPPLVIKGHKLPHPWALDPGDAFVTPTVPDMFGAGPHIRDCLRSSSGGPYDLPEDTQGRCDLKPSKDVQTIAGHIERHLRAELSSLQVARDQDKALPERSMREVLRRRSLMLWRGMAYAVDYSRAFNIAARREQQQQQQSEVAAAAAAASSAVESRPQRHVTWHDPQ